MPESEVSQSGRPAKTPKVEWPTIDTSTVVGAPETREVSVSVWRAGLPVLLVSGAALLGFLALIGLPFIRQHRGAHR